VLRYVTDKPTLHAHLEQTQPDGVVLDFGMRVPGDQVYTWLKEWSKTLKIVFYTCWANDQAEKRKMIKAGATEREIVWKREVGSDIRKLLRVLT
jgi:DNA-binding NarL/FixJ family response regulator